MMCLVAYEVPFHIRLESLEEILPSLLLTSQQDARKNVSQARYSPGTNAINHVYRHLPRKVPHR